MFQLISDETNARLHRIESLLTTDAEYIKRRLFMLERIFSDGGDNILRYYVYYII